MSRHARDQHVERASERLQCRDTVAGGPRFHADRSGEPDVAQRLCDGGIVDLAGSRLASSGYVGHLDLADGVAAAADQLDEVSFADLSVVDVEHHLDVRVCHAFDQRQGVLGASQRDTGMIDDRC